MSKNLSVFPFGSIFSRSLDDLVGDLAMRSPSSDIACYKTETDSGTAFMFDVPGVQKSDLDIGFDDSGRLLTVGATRKFDDGEVKMKARVLVPEKGDIAGEVKCSLSDGVLTVTIPTKKESQPRKLTIE
jgi:HSP20 family molecular chaperone IbpA